MNIPVRITSPQGKQAAGEVEFQEWDEKTRMKRGLRFLGMAWGAAVVAVLIPGLHFILVPSFLIAGPIGAYIVHSQTSAIVGGHGKCPECQADLPIVKSPDRWPLKDLCSKCQTDLSIERV